ncbi:MAG: hypothetical protein JNM79_16515 [Burkholderiales bacterium]|nr:hypothetical protein [Burkholderiales bacterium]
MQQIRVAPNGRECRNDQPIQGVDPGVPFGTPDGLEVDASQLIVNRRDLDRFPAQRPRIKIGGRAK